MVDIYIGQTSTMLRVMLRDPLNNFQGKTGVTTGNVGISITPNNLEPSLLTAQSITTIGVYEAPSNVSSVRFGEVDGVRTPGLYEMHFYDSTFNFLSIGAAKSMDLFVRGTIFIPHWERFAVLPSLYWADILYLSDPSAGTDEYVITWYKDGIPITSGITVTEIDVYKADDGTALLLSSLPQVGSTGIFRLSVTPAGHVAGQEYKIVTRATIDGAVRTWTSLVGRDSV